MIKTIIYSSTLSYFTALFSFLSTMIIAKNINIDTFGKITLGLAIGGFIQILLNYASDKIFIKELLDKPINPFSYSTIQLIFQLLILFIFIFFFKIIDNTDGLLFYVIVWFSIISISPKSIYDYKSIIIKNTIIHFFERLLSLIIILLFVLNYQTIDILILEKLFKLLILIRIIFTILQMIFVYEKVALKEYMNSFLYFFQNIKKRFYITIALISNSLMFFGLQIMTKIELDYKSIAIYGLSLQLTLIVVIVQSQLIRHLNKKIFLQTMNNNFNINEFNKLFKISIYLSIPLSIAMLSFSYFLENYYLDNSYKGLFNISIILSIWLNVLGVGTIISQYFISLHSEKLYLYINLLGGIISILGSFFLFSTLKIYTGSIILLIVHSSMILTYYLYILKMKRSEK